MVRGTAVVTRQTDKALLARCPKKVAVELKHPRTGRSYKLHATAISWNIQTGRLQLTLKGSSPTERARELPAALARNAVEIEADPSETLRASLGLAETSVGIEGLETETIALTFTVDSLFQLADGHWSYAGTGTGRTDQRRAIATPAVGGGVEQWTTVQPLENYAELRQWCIALSSRLLAVHTAAQAVAELEAALVPAARQAADVHPLARKIAGSRALLDSFRRQFSVHLNERSERRALISNLEKAQEVLATARKRRAERDEEIFVVVKGDNVVAAVTADSIIATQMLKQLRKKRVDAERQLREALKGRPKKEVERIVKESAVLDRIQRHIRQTQAIRDGDAESAKLGAEVARAERVVAARNRDIETYDRREDRGLSPEALQALWTQKFLPAYAAIRDRVGKTPALKEIKQLSLPAYAFEFKKLPPLGGAIDGANAQAQYRKVEAAVFEVVQLQHLLQARLRALDPYVRSQLLRLGGLNRHHVRVVKQALATRLGASRAAEAAARVLAKKDPDAYGPLLKDLGAFNAGLKQTAKQLEYSQKTIDYLEKGRRALGFSFAKDFMKKSVEQMETFAKYLKNANEVPEVYQSYLEIRSDLLNASDNPVRALDALQKSLGVAGKLTKHAGKFGDAFSGGTAKLLAMYLDVLASAVGGASKGINGINDRIIAADLALVLSDPRKKPELYLFTRAEVRAAMSRARTPEEKINRVTSYLQLRRLTALLSAKNLLVIRGTRR